MVKVIKDFVSLRTEFVNLFGPENFTFKSNIKDLKFKRKTQKPIKQSFTSYKTLKQNSTPVKCKKTKPTV